MIPHDLRIVRRRSWRHHFAERWYLRCQNCLLRRGPFDHEETAGLVAVAMRDTFVCPGWRLL